LAKVKAGNININKTYLFIAQSLMLILNDLL